MDQLPTNRSPASPLHLRLYNTLKNEVEEFVATDPSHVTFYTCGPTVYDDAHIGNFRSFLAADVLRRFLESPLCAIKDAAGMVHAGPRRVTHVMNITDVGHMTDDAEGGESGEDRMAVAGRRLLEAKKAGTLPKGVEVNPGDPYQIARFYEARFREDSRALGLKVIIDGDTNPSRTPRATENIAGMIAVINRLVKRKQAYEVGKRGQRVVYFDVSKFSRYGDLSGNRVDALREGEGGRVLASHQSQKKHPSDFLLWKEDSSHIMKWESPWGKGYPGWHIECTAMSISGLRKWSDMQNLQELRAALRRLLRVPQIHEEPLALFGATVEMLAAHYLVEADRTSGTKFPDAQIVAAFVLRDELQRLSSAQRPIVPSETDVERWLQKPMSSIVLCELLFHAKSTGLDSALIDVHSGGEDNIFPHHECEIAQSCCAFNVPVFARMWFHPRFLLVEGTKMSKSKGNFFTARDLFAQGIEPAAIRLELIRTHYRSNANFTMQGLKDSQRRIDRWRRRAWQVLKQQDRQVAPITSGYKGAPTDDTNALKSRLLVAKDQFAEALSDDMNLPWAISILDDLASFGSTDSDAEIAAKLPTSPMDVSDAVKLMDSGIEGQAVHLEYAMWHLMDAIIGVVFVPRAQSTQTEIGVFAPGVTPDAKVEELLRQRRDARAKKDFAASDKIRDELAAMGFAIKDMAGGKVEVRKS